MATAAAPQQTFEGLLQSAWAGEVLGEATFAAAAERFPDDAGLWRCFADLERTVGGLVASVAAPLGIEVDEPAIADAARRFVGSASLTAAAVVEASLAYLPGAIASYEALGAVVPEEYRWLAEELLAHERALEADLLRVRADGAACTEAVSAFLARHADRAR